MTAFLGFSKWCYVAGLELNFSHPAKGKQTLLEENCLLPHQLFLFIYIANYFSFQPTFLNILVYKSISYRYRTVCTAILHFTYNKSVVAHSVTHLYLCLNSPLLPFSCTYLMKHFWGLFSH